MYNICKLAGEIHYMGLTSQLDLYEDWLDANGDENGCAFTHFSDFAAKLLDDKIINAAHDIDGDLTEDESAKLLSALFVVYISLEARMMQHFKRVITSQKHSLPVPVFKYLCAPFVKEIYSFKMGIAETILRLPTAYRFFLNITPDILDAYSASFGQIYPKELLFLSENNNIVLSRDELFEEMKYIMEHQLDMHSAYHTDFGAYMAKLLNT